MNQNYFPHICLGILLSLGSMTYAGAPEMPPSIVLAEKVGMKTQQISRTYIGKIEAISSVNILPRVSGIIDAIPVKEGQVVTQGTVLFEIEKIRYQAAVQSAESKIKQLDAEIHYAQTTYDRQNAILKEDAISKDEVDNAKSTLDKLMAQRSANEADLILAKEDLAYCTIKAPFTGKIGRVNFHQGQYITPTTSSLASITQLDPIYVRFNISEQDLQEIFGNPTVLQKEAIVKIQTANGAAYQEVGSIAITDNMVDTGTDTLTVWAKFENPDSILIPGGIATVKLIKKEEKNLPSITLSAVQHDQNGAFVYIINEQGQAMRTPVTLGEIENKKQTILEGLNEGQTVIIDGVHKIRPGVQIVPQFKKSN